MRYSWNKRRVWIGALMLGLCTGVPAVAAESNAESGQSNMPATKHQQETLKESPADDEKAPTGEAIHQTDDMPTTPAQADKLREQKNMSEDGTAAGKDSGSQ